VTTEEGRQRQRYLSVRHAAKIKKGAEQRRQLEAILREITKINVELMEMEEDDELQS
jgi:chaperonin cofactor prefoldin